MNSVYLMGAETVERAASRMKEAATEMQQAANNIAYTLENHQRFLSDWLDRFQALMEQKR